MFGNTVVFYIMVVCVCVESRVSCAVCGNGVPVVACRAGGIPELVIHEKTGLSSEVKDSANLAKQVLRLLNDDALKTQLITQAKKHLQHFSREQTAVNTLQQYEDLLNSQPAP